MKLFFYLAIFYLFITSGESACVAPCPLQPGLRGSYYNGTTLGDNMTVPPVLIRYETINFNWGWNSPLPGILGTDYFSILWEGVLTAPTTGVYEFMTSSDDGHDFYFNGFLYSDLYGRGIFPNVSIAPQELIGGTNYHIRFDYMELTGNAYADLYWRPPGGDWAAVPFASLSGPSPTCPQRHLIVPAQLVVNSNTGYTILNISLDGPISAPVSVYLTSTCVGLSDCLITFGCDSPTTLSVKVYAADCRGGKIFLVSDSNDITWDTRTAVVDVVVVKDQRAQCLSWGDPHILTFDGLRYDSLLNGVHTLVQSSDGSFVMQALQEMCVLTVCNLAVVIKYQTTIFQVEFDSNYQLIVTYYQNPPENNVIISSISGGYDFATPLGIEVAITAVPYKNVSSITVLTYVTTNLQNELFGLCGNYNGIPGDDSNSTNQYQVPDDQNLFLNKTITFPSNSTSLNVTFPTCGRIPPANSPCSPSPCQNGATCILNGTSYQCECPPGFTGLNCDQTTNTPNPCASRPCLNGGTCVRDGDGFICYCPPGFTGPTCGEVATCPCDSNPCEYGSTCIVQGDDYTCKCPSGCYKKVCEPFNPCDSNPCVNGSTCIVEGNTYTCKCPSGSYGRHCEPIPNPCDPNPCQNGASCVANGIFYTCQCPPGTYGNDCTAPNPCDPNPCQNGASCIANGIFYTCQCPPGTYGSDCTIPNPCDPNPCQNGASCIANGIFYTCQGTSGNNCTAPNPCEPNPCQNGATCVAQGNDYTCKCKSGCSGRHCETQNPSNPCQSNPCQNGGTCVARRGYYFCKCKSGFFGKLCDTQPPSNPCNPNPCQNGATCVAQGNDYTCKCKPGCSGKHCETQPPSNPCQPNPCQNGATCVAQGNDYTCKCKPGCSGKNCETQPPSNPCQPNPCQNGATCVAQGNDYTCKCKSGCSGRHCETTNPCQPNPCQNGGTCSSRNNSFSCQCNRGYTGSTCNKRSR